MADHGFNPRFAQRLNYPLTVRGNRIVDAKGRKIAVIFTDTANATAQYIATKLNEASQQSS